MTEEKEILQEDNIRDAESDSSLPVQDILDIKNLLTPVSEDNPAGESLRYEGAYDSIREARQEDDASLPQGIWERGLKKANWKQVKTLCLNALETQSKDLQIAVWLLESLIHLHGFSGVKQGLEIIESLCREFWDDLYPEIAEDDVEARISPLIWMNEKLSVNLKLIPITMPHRDTPSHTFSDWENANLLEKDGAADRSIIERAESEGKVTRAKFLGTIMFSPVSFYRAGAEQLKICSEILTDLDRFLGEKCGKDAPSLKNFKDIITEIQNLIHSFIQEKEEKEPEPDDTSPDEEWTESYVTGDKTRGMTPLSIRNRAEAYRILSAVADYLLIHEPHSPTPYLVKRAVSWGNKSLTELLHELVADEHDLSQILRLLGLQGPVT
ncbi:MAG: type VI secretion system protein TssA [Desulfobacteraceae bacterium]|nr:type VI secretion system protein TssA [Desulfobacteraceae bacterium]